MELNFFYAKHKHRMWKMKLKAYLLGLDDLDENKIVSDQECELGQWINQVGWEAYKHHPEMQQLVDKHQLIHQVVEEIPKLKKTGDLQKATNQYNRLEEESDKLIGLIEAIEEKSKNINNQQENMKSDLEQQVDKTKSNP